MAFQDAAEVTKYIGGIFESAFADPEIGPKLEATGLVLQFSFQEPECILTIDMGGKAVSAGVVEGLPPSATMAMTADIGNAYWQGKVNLPLAMAKSKIKVEGNVASLLKLAPMGKKLYPVYIGNLESDGRQDLLV